jgi:Tol biopolymer transport system component
MSFHVADMVQDPSSITWSVDAANVVYALADTNSDNLNIWSQPMTGNTSPRLIARLRSGEIFELSGLAFSPDGRSLAAVQGNWNHNAVLIRGLK